MKITSNGVIKTQVLLLLLCLHAFTSFGQKTKFKDIYPIVENGTFMQAVPILRDYIKEDYNHPAANFNIAVLYEERYLAFDPIREFPLAIKNAELAQNAFSRALDLVDKKDVRRNDDFYSKFSKPHPRSGKPIVEFEDIEERINSSLEKVNLYRINVPQIHHSFVKMVNHYDQATRLFSTINGEYSSLKEMYMLYQDSLESKLNLLIQSYDSTIYYFDQYKKHLLIYPLEGYNQDYEIQKIEHYRLDGLISELNFFQEKVMLWDYKSWAKDIKKVVEYDIQNLSRQITDAYRKVQDNHKLIYQEAEVTFFRAPNDLRFKIGRYDFNPIIVPYMDLEYEKARYKRDIFEFFGRDSAEVNKNLRLSFLSSLVQRIYDKEKLLARIDNLNDSKNFYKYYSIWEGDYPNPATLTARIKREKEELNQEKQAKASEIRESLYGPKNKEVDKKTYSFKGLSIPANLHPIPPDSLKAGEVSVNHIIANADGSQYLAGYFINQSKQNLQSFIIRVSEKDRVEWIHYLNLSLDGGSPSFHNQIGALQSTPEGCAFLWFARHTDLDLLVNTLMVLDEKGKEFYKVTLDTQTFPRALIYLEENNALLAIFKGLDSSNSVEGDNDLYITELDFEGNVYFEKSFAYSGNVVNAHQMGRTTLIAGNLGKRQLPNSLFSESSQPYVIRFDGNGDIINQITMNGNQGHQVQRVDKIGNRHLSMVGIEEWEKDEIEEGFGQRVLYHALLNDQLETLIETVP